MSPSDKPSRLGPALRFVHLWMRRLATVVLLVVLLTLATAVLLWSVGAEFLAARTTAIINARILGPDTHLTIGEVKGSPFRRLVLRNVVLERTLPEGSFEFLSARELELTYDLWGLLHGRYVLSRATARGLHLDFRRQGSQLVLPTFRGGGGGKQSGPAPPFRIRELRVLEGGATVALPWRTVEVDSLSAELALEGGRDGISFDLGRLHGVMQDSLGSVHLLDGTLEIGSPIRLEGMQGTWDGAGIAATGVVAKAPLDLEIHVAELPLERLGRFLQDDNLEPGYVTRADGTLQVNEGRVTFWVDAQAAWDPWVADTVLGTGTIEDGMLRLRDVHASIEGASLTEVELDIPLHEQEFTARGRARNLNTATLRIPFFDRVPGTIGGRAELRFLDRRDMGRDMDLWVQAEEGVLLDVPVQSGTVVAQAREGVFRFDSLLVNLEGARVAATGKTSETFIDLELGYEGRIEPLRRLIRREEAEGTASVRGTLNGPPRSPILLGTGEIRNVVVASVRAPRVRVVELDGPVNEEQALAVHAVADSGLTVGDIAFAGGETRFTVARDSVRVESLALANGDTTVTAHGSFRWEPEIVAWVTEAIGSADGRRFTSAAPFQLRLREEEVASPGMTLLSSRGSLTIAGFWDFATRRYAVDAVVQGIDPSVLFPPESPPPLAVGKVSGTVSLTGTGQMMEGKVALGLREIDWTRGHLDSAYIAASAVGGEVHIDRLMATYAGGEVTVTGDLGLPEGVVAVARGLREKRYPDPTLTRYRLEVEAWDVDLGQWKFLMPPTHRFLGWVDLKGSLEGTSAAPILTVDSNVRGLAWKGFEADSVSARARYAQEVVEVTDLRIAEEGQSVSVSGTFPTQLTLMPFSFDIPERAMALTLEARNGSLRGLELTPWIRKAEGGVRARITVEGTPRRPLAQGWARVEGGRVELRERDEVVEDVRAQFVFEGDVVRVENAEGRLTVRWARAGTAGGKVKASGTYRLAALTEQSYRLAVDLENGFVGEEGVYAGRVSGHVDVEPIRAPDGKLYPTATGNLFVHRLEYAGSLKPQDVAASGPPKLLYSVSLNAPEKIFIRTDQTQAELGGELSVRRTLDGFVVLGTLEILSGSYQFFQKTFRVTDGRLIWDSAVTRIPDLDIRAETKQAGYLIVVDLQGPADQPEIQFSAQSLAEETGRDLTQDEIIQLLALGAVGLAQTSGTEGPTEVTPGGVGAGGAAAGWGLMGAEQLFGSEIERQLLQQIGISAEVQVETESQRGEYEPKVGIRTYVTPELSLQYLQGLSRTYEQDVGVEYRLRRLIVLRGSVVNLPLESKQEYNLDLKFRQEY